VHGESTGKIVGAGAYRLGEGRRNGGSNSGGVGGAPTAGDGHEAMGLWRGARDVLVKEKARKGGER
jgi:hypothetical protein